MYPNIRYVTRTWQDSNNSSATGPKDIWYSVPVPAGARVISTSYNFGRVSTGSIVVFQNQLDEGNEFHTWTFGMTVPQTPSEEQVNLWARLLCIEVEGFTEV